ncbi:hypothetical protein [Streptomyces kanamyceticus]|uniref:Beta-ketoacyl synthase N-terminal domain-containing protein n=1 Tax=Streptomyces kanamyceticus TaxID=1967 RepID=A0A5J6GC27_STRKN|nr:hypothetical protein [Streptomyces kanamyceticus]QEU92653.1 hypothetical protein CP970_18630 [Streptomyces kanamyceticus]
MFEFTLGPVALCAPGPAAGQDEHEGLPPDLHEVIGTAGDKFRDAFTRICLYLVLGGGEAPPESERTDEAPARTDDTIVIGTEYGNTAALAGLQRAAAEKGRLLSAQYFPNATSSSASAFVNIRTGATGRSMTINAGTLTPVVALWQALSTLHQERSDVGRLLIGDVYAPEAVADAALDAPDATCRDGVTHAFLRKGAEFTAEFAFGAADEPYKGALRTVRRSGGTDATAEGTSPVAFAERNSAFATRAFLDLVHSLAPAERAVLECHAPDGRHATVTVTRRQANSTSGRSL